VAARHISKQAAFNVFHVSDLILSRATCRKEQCHPKSLLVEIARSHTPSRAEKWAAHAVSRFGVVACQTHKQIPGMAPECSLAILTRETHGRTVRFSR